MPRITAFGKNVGGEDASLPGISHCFRLHRGDDLKRSIQDYAKKHGIKASVIVSGVGCLSRACIRDATGERSHTLAERLEIVSLTGTVGAERTHLHIALAREDLSVLGGHLLEGCTVNTTAEIVLLELPGWRFGKTFDETTGYDEIIMEECEK